MTFEHGLLIGIGVGLLVAAVSVLIRTRKSDPPTRWLVRDQNDYDVSPVLQQYFTLVEQGTHPQPPRPAAGSNPSTKEVDLGLVRRYRVH